MSIPVQVTKDVNVDPITGYPHISVEYAHTYVSTDDVAVDYDAEPNEDGSLITIRRTVWTKARNSRNRHIVWIDTAMVLPRAMVPDHIRDLVSCLVD